MMKAKALLICADGNGEMISPHIILVPVDLAFFGRGVHGVNIGIFKVFACRHGEGGDVLEHAAVDTDFAIEKVFHWVVHVFGDEFLGVVGRCIVKRCEKTGDIRSKVNRFCKR